MSSVERINTQHIIKIGISPKDTDLAIVSIDAGGAAGQLNSYVLKEFGYLNRDLPTYDQLEYGFHALTHPGKKPILFVVTVNGGQTSENLDNNLYNTLIEFRGWFQKKRVWLPLMGTGDGGLSLAESFNITAGVVNRFQETYPTETTFLISLPNNEDGYAFMQSIKNLNTDSRKVIDSFLNSFQNKFYLVGSIWDGEDQVDRFFEEGIWENGHSDDRYVSVISQIEKGDVLIIKSTFAMSGISFLRIKAFGQVVNNSKDGRVVEIDWKIKGLSLDIEHLGSYRSAISLLDTGDIPAVLEQIDPALLVSFLNKKPNSKPYKVAGLISDSEKGIDYLNITKDVTAFARVISAKSFEPPLAVALFGKWGSGKSFFMCKLKEQIKIFSSNEESNVYCNGIAHIHFNAWSYMDANLWASIITKIFEGLYEYISENSRSDEAKKEIKEQLIGQLSSTQVEIGALEEKKDSVKKQISNLESTRKEAKDDLDDKIEKIRTNTVWNAIKNIDKEFGVKDKLMNALNQNESYIKTEDQLKNIIPEKYWENPEMAYQLAKSKYIFLKEFFRGDKIIPNLLWLGAILILIFSMPLLLALTSLKISSINFSIPQSVLSSLVLIGAIWKRGEAVYKELQPVVLSFWTIKEDYEKKIKEAVSQFGQEEKALKLEIEKGKSEIVLIDEQMQRAVILKNDLELKITHSLSTEALYSFIDKRSKSEDYKKHLGIISIVRKDLEILNDLFNNHNQEATKARQARELKSKFRKPLERIILYIDDLDRCPADNVMQVLEAVNLLMAFPLFVVVVGVDSKWVKNALLNRHSLQFAKSGDADLKNDPELVGSSDYLEKIFQIPFHLKSAEDVSVKDMIRQLAETSPHLDMGNDVNVIREDIVNENSMEKVANLAQTNNTKKDNDTVQDAFQYVDRPEALILTEYEISLMQDLSVVIGDSPRAIKRFVNTFRIIKAHEEFDYNKDTEKLELPVILFLLALPLGKYKKLLQSFEAFIANESNKSKPLTLYLQQIHKISGLDELKHQLNVMLSNKPSFTTLQDSPVNMFFKHNLFIKRFTFKDM